MTTRRSNVIQLQPTRAPGEPRRFVPNRGERLTLQNIIGEWWPTGSVAGAGVFAVRWATRSGEFWAPLHDFEPDDALRLIDACRDEDRAQGLPGAPAWWKGTR